MRDVTILRRACRQLAPASLSWRPSAPRHTTFLHDVRVTGDTAHISLAPMGGTPAPGEIGRLDFALDDKHYVISGLIADFSPRRVVMTTRGDLKEREPRSGRITPPAGRMVAVFVPDGVGLGRCCQPILDVNLRVMRIQSRHPFEPGTLLRSLRLVLRNGVVRACEGVVLSRLELVDPFDRKSYECRVRLRAPTRLEPEDDPADLHEITLPARVRSILWALCDLSHPVTLRAAGSLWRGQLEPVKGSRDALPQLRCRIAGDLPPIAGAVQLECALYGSGYRIYARSRGQVGHVLMLAPAPVVREWHRRDEERVQLPTQARATLSFRHPISGQRYTRAVEDVAVGGVGLRPEGDDELLWPDLPLQDVRLSLPNVVVKPAHATVRTLSAQRCGVQIGPMSLRDTDRLRVELVRLGARPIELHDGENLDAILRFHDSVRLLETDMLRNLDATLDETRRQWRAAHQHPDGLMRTAIVRWKDGIGATLTLVRAYESSWMLQHSAVASPAVPANPGMLHSLLVRLAIPRPDGEFVCGYIDEEARSQHAVMNAFFTEWSTPEFRGATRFGLYSAPTGRALPPPATVRRIRGGHADLVERAARRLLDDVCVGALGLRRGEVELAATRAAFARVGIVRGREAWGSFRAGRCRAILVREMASPGLCLSSLLSAGTILPITDDAAEDVAALCRYFLGAPLPGSPPFRFLFLPDGCDDAALTAAGLRRIAGCTLYAMHRFGLQEYHRFVASRYGFLHGRLRARAPEAA